MLFLKTLDAGVYQRALERELSSVLDRKVSIGSVSFDLALRPTLSVRDLRIANPPWASRPDFVTAASGKAHSISSPCGRVGSNCAPCGWRAWTCCSSAMRRAKAIGLRHARSRHPARGIARLRHRVADRRPHRLAARRRRAEQVRVDTAEATISAGVPFRVQALADYRHTPMQLTVEANASLQAALDGEPWRLSVGLRPKGAALALDVRLASIASLEGVELGIEATGEHLDAWSGVLGGHCRDGAPIACRRRPATHEAACRSKTCVCRSMDCRSQPSRLEIGSGRAVLGASVDTRLDARGQDRRCGVLARGQQRAMAGAAKDRWRRASRAARRAGGLHAERQWQHHARGRRHGLRPGADRPGRRAGAAAPAGGPAPGPPLAGGSGGAGDAFQGRLCGQKHPWPGPRARRCRGSRLRQRAARAAQRGAEASARWT